MYPQARIFIRTALAYLVAAFLVGALVLVNQGLALDSRIGALLPVFYHLLMVGWTTQLICGVALWMFPPFSREQPRGDERLGWATYALLNSGLLLRVVAEPLHAWQPAPWSGWALAISGVLQATSIWIFVAAIWPRVKGRSGDKERGRHSDKQTQ
ncbi:MAG TPA: hypothetical protein VFT66_08360 [Roseiflexaceae bacterium]|jgi:hypothetical protein|nr:hypothetical protein [Roseiflexaceae bacterium]